MEYKNTRTDVVINTSCVIAGGDWVPFDSDSVREKVLKVEMVQEIPERQQEAVQDPVETPEGFDDITVAQIKQELDAFGVEYNQKDNKRVLYDLMMQQGK